MSRASAETPQKRDEEMRVKKHIEIVVPLVPVREIPGLAPDERVAELQLRVAERHVLASGRARAGGASASSPRTTCSRAHILPPAAACFPTHSPASRPVTIAVTGATGLIGAALVEQLVAHGHTVRRLLHSSRGRARGRRGVGRGT